MRRLEETFPADVASFEESFPPLCKGCAPRVEEIIKEKDYDAQVNAWSIFLSGGPEETRTNTGQEPARRSRSTLQMILSYAWGLWILSYPPYRCLIRECLEAA